MKRSWIVINGLGLMFLGAAHAAAHAQTSAQFVTAALPAATTAVSQSRDIKSYRIDGAKHIYAAYPDRIYRGKLPPLLYAIVVVEMVLDEKGHATAVNVIRAPSHAPEVTQAVRELIHQVMPMPRPVHLQAGVRYIETWLVDRSGRFQLDALSEGQRSE